MAARLNPCLPRFRIGCHDPTGCTPAAITGVVQGRFTGWQILTLWRCQLSLMGKLMIWIGWLLLV